MKFDANRYERMPYRRCGRSGLLLPAISLGMWHNFGTCADHERCREMTHTAFDLGVTHFDLANNYGPEPGSAEERVGKILKKDFAGYRDELIISTKAGYNMWPGPYGEWGSRKYLTASLDQSLRRLGLDYVDIFYSHRFDPNTPLEETLGALEQLVRQGKALYAGVSNYWAADFVRASEIVRHRDGGSILINQVPYNLFDRRVETETLGHAEDYGTGVIVFSPLAQGLLTSKYLDPDNPVPHDSRAGDSSIFLSEDALTDEARGRVRELAALAEQRGQDMAQMAIAWTLRNPAVTSALIGARSAEQIRNCVGALDNLDFSQDELDRIDAICPQ